MSDSRPALPIYALLMVAIAGGSTMLFEAPFESTRPKEDQVEAVDVDSMDVPARLWQDPLSVVLEEYRRRQGTSETPCDWKSAMPIRWALGDPDASPLGTAGSGCHRGRLAAHLAKLYTIQEARSNEAGAADSTQESVRATEDGESDASVAARLLILPVMVRGGYYQSEIEARRRSRYAVLTALMYQEFEPLESRFLGYFVAPINSPESGQPENRLVAYEILKRHGRDVVLVLWVPDQLSVPWPPPFLPELACDRLTDATGKVGQANCPQRPNVSYAVIGPATSDTLISLVADAIANGSSLAPGENDSIAKDTPPLPPREPRQPVRAPLISPFASASGLRVIERVRKEHPQTNALISRNERDYLSDDPIADSRNGHALLKKHLTEDCDKANCFSEYVPVGGDDAYLAWMMARELVARGIDTFDCSVKDPKHSVALIGESDRAFTKLWLEEMWYQARLECSELKLTRQGKKKKKLADVRSKRFKYKSRFCKGQSLNKENQKTRPACVVSFKYLQGLDGSGVNIYAKKSGSGPTKTMGIETVDPSLLARPVGESQFDYLRRLADEVRRENGFLRDEGSDGIRAIGIFGSDIYDKLLILQALKQELPDAIYFTNDLDARLTHPANYQWTRNLLVGSAYGLTLGHRKCIAGAPPFRDGYQSSTFMATLLALHRGEMLEVSRLGNDRCRWRTVFAAPHSLDPEENLDLYYRKMLRPPGLLAAVHHWQVPRPRLYEISRNGAEDITPTLPYRLGEAPERFNAAVHRTAGPSKPSLRAFLPPALAMIGFIALVLVLTGVTDRIFAGSGTPLSRGAPPWKLNKYISKRDPVPFPHVWIIAVGLAALFASTWLVWSTGEDPLVAEGLFEIPVFDRAVPTACEEACTRQFSEKDARGDCIKACPNKWEAPSQQHPRRLGLMAHAPTAAILGFWAIAVLLRWRRYTRHGDRVWHVNPTVFSLLVALNLVVTALTFWLLSTRSPFFEPMALASGTSSWPSELLRLLAIVVAVPLIFFSSRYLWQKTIEQVSEFFGGQVEFDPGHLGRWLPLTWGHPTELDAITTPEPLSERVAQYLRYCRGSRRFVRTLGLVSLHILTVLPLLWYYGLPPPPLRGLYAQAVDAYLMFAMIPLLVFSAMFATDATRMCGRLLRCVASGNVVPDFSDDVVRSAGIRVGLRGDSQEPAPVDDGVREYLRLDFIAQLTKPITPLIILPFFLIMILVISRSSLFDNWQWNVSVLVLTLSVATYSILSAIRLRRAAEEARATVIGRLGSMKRAVASGAKGEGSMTTGQVDALIGLVSAEERGAFNRWFRNPVVQALLLPFGGAGALALVEFALNAG